jgi:cellulose synthase/poly-beta-1,6-N-acetylglucosamine synthase-like glycosyltransferase
MIFIGMAYDTTESMFALFASPKETPKRVRLDQNPPVALLMTVCNDIRPDCWDMLSQAYSNCDVFILDDSSDPEQKFLVDQSSFLVIRRERPRAFKAGNLNHWLQQYGAQYKYFAVLDSDSVVSPDFIEKMVQYAEHPSNEKIAIFQSAIFPTNANTHFAKLLGSMSRMRIHILQRFANRANLILSWGHNQLVRTRNVIDIGGFYEGISAEDTAISLMLSANGYTTRLVDVVTYDTDPPDIQTFLRRTSRWAGQTAEVFMLSWEKAPLRLKLLLCYHLYSYLMHNFYFGLLLITAWGFDSTQIDTGRLFSFIRLHFDYFWPWVLVLVVMMTLWVGQLLIRLRISRISGVSTRDFWLHLILSNAMVVCAAWSINVSILKVTMGKRQNFIPTNTNHRKWNSFEFLVNFVPGFLIVCFILAGMILRNPLLFFSLNSLWLLLWLMTPFTLLFFHRDQLFTRGMPA